jgi:hypothetical protein
VAQASALSPKTNCPANDHADKSNKNTDGSETGRTVKFSRERACTVTSGSNVNIKLQTNTTVDTATFGFFNAMQQLPGQRLR